MLVTQEQIAQELGVSLRSVTRALNGHDKVGTETRQKILAKARDLGYTQYSNSHQRALAARRHGRRISTGAIAMVYPTTAGHAWLDQPYHREFVNGVIMEAGRRKLALNLLPLNEDGTATNLQPGGIDGAIFQVAPNNMEEIAGLQLPIVFLGGYGGRWAQSLRADEETGAYLATRHLIELGHVRIGFLGAYPEFGTGKARYAGYRRALRESSLPLEDEWLINGDDSDQNTGYELMKRLLARVSAPGGRPPFTALCCFNDGLGMGAARLAREAGLCVPQDLSIVGFDDISLEYQSQPALTSISFPRHEMGRRAVEWICEETSRLIQSANDDARPENGAELFPVTLVQRDSTCPPS